ncbi:50S ribosomal protein L1 [archaeon]|jgi:large subunit ribosomal protein L1|nr:50S ribosomal protein L1 [archaeon]MBT3731312.1 50S ribosomal protein L1 [archaeon]MBT4669965.1 50S ribosomal protein L1 [archaeon]MBT5029790.1 50S ribosomal protein L1 [archaeon]MBT5287461.1 50S ribosomal protein L1 [archaeon]
MDKNNILEAVKELRKNSKERNFSQTFDLQVKLHNMDLKKPENKFETFVAMPNKRGRKVKVCALVGGSLFKDAQESADLAIIQDDFKNITQNKKEVKNIVREHDFFIAQADIMAAVATSFGRYLGPKSKMPNPKAGCIVAPKGNIKNIVEKLQRTVRLAVKSELSVKCSVGKDDMDDEKIAENIMAAYQGLVNALPQHENNIKFAAIKFTMSKAVKIGGKK